MIATLLYPVIVIIILYELMSHKNIVAHTFLISGIFRNNNLIKSKSINSLDDYVTRFLGNSCPLVSVQTAIWR